MKVDDYMKIVDGNKACANTAYWFSEICPLYPITPASPMGSTIDDLSNKGELNFFDNKVKLISMQSEAGAAAAMHGALLSGNLSTTFTASQGLLLMIPEMYKMAGEMLPAVIHVASRAVATHALSIFGEHSDIYAARSTGFCILASSNVEDAQDIAAIAHLSAIKGELPFIHFFDGFRTSHEINKIDDLDKEKIKNLLPVTEIENFRDRMLLGTKKNERGLAQNEDIFFQISEARNKAYMEMTIIVKDYMKELGKITGRKYAPFTYYGHPYAKNIIISMGSVTETIKLVVDDLNNKGAKVGVVNVTLFRPFSQEYLREVIPANVSRIAVLDRAKEATMSGEALYLDVLNAMKGKIVDIVGGRYGLASKDTTPAMIKSVFDMLDGEMKNNFTIGIIDDVTQLSLPIPDYDLELGFNEIEIFGFGSDGMVSASKNIMTVLGATDNNYVQGYFEYDSKKSNGLTISHLRYAKKIINAPFYPTNPKLVVVTKDTYLSRFNVLKGISDYGTFILNTSKDDKEIKDLLSKEMVDIIRKKNLKFLIIDASKLALECGIKGKISKIIETIILRNLNIVNYENILIESVKKAFATKGEEIINANINAIKESVNALRSVNTLALTSDVIYPKEKYLIDLINNRKGSSLKVSEVMPFVDGAFPCGSSKFEKRKIANDVPKWKSENCLQCNQCSLVCPHAVIRPFILPKTSDKGIPYVGNDEYKYLVAVSEADCTSCGLCIKACPGKNGEKALKFGPLDENNSSEINELFNKHVNPSLMDKYNVKGSQFCKPLFEFSGACAGCGETPYIKILSQLVGEKLVIANATGCSSIYGGSMPSTPYLVPWANSLFEDNAEFGLGILLGYQLKKEKIKKIMEDNKNGEYQDLYTKWLSNLNDYEKTKEVEIKLRENPPKELLGLLDFVVARSIWTIGGDGWAYDIGYSGIDHVLSSNLNANILVLDTEVYSNTGGQASKSSQLGQVCEFANFGKRTLKKDLFAKAMSIPNVYVANVSIGSNPMQTIRAIKEAEAHDGPSIIIAYAPCLEQGIKGGLTNAVDEQKLAVNCGYLTLMRWENKKLTIDSPEPQFDKYKDFLANEVRYNALKIKNSSLYDELIEEQITFAKERYNHYLEIAKKE